MHVREVNPVVNSTSLRSFTQQVRVLQSQYIRQISTCQYTDKKENEIFLIYKEIQIGTVAKSCMRKGFLIYEEMRKCIYQCKSSMYIFVEIVVYNDIPIKCKGNLFFSKKYRNVPVQAP
jgi:hypothetical protein